MLNMKGEMVAPERWPVSQAGSGRRSRTPRRRQGSYHVSVTDHDSDGDGVGEKWPWDRPSHQVVIALVTPVARGRFCGLH